MAPERRRVLVTGAGSGIGRELALCAARDGAGVDLVGRRADALAATLHLLPGDGHRVVAADVATAGGRADVVAAVAAAGGRLAVLANNAGRVASGLLADTTDRTIEEVLATNVAAPLALTRSLLPALAGGGRVLFVGSVFGDIGHPYFAAYSVSKHAVRGMADALRRELAPRGISVTHLAPRGTRTDAAQGFQSLVGPMAALQSTLPGATPGGGGALSITAPAAG